MLSCGPILRLEVSVQWEGVGPATSLDWAPTWEGLQSLTVDMRRKAVVLERARYGDVLGEVGGTRTTDSRAESVEARRVGRAAAAAAAQADSDRRDQVCRRTPRIAAAKELAKAAQEEAAYVARRVDPHSRVGDTTTGKAHAAVTATTVGTTDATAVTRTTKDASTSGKLRQLKRSSLRP